MLIGYPRNEEEKHCLPYYDWFVSIGCRFDISFIIILVLENANFGLWILVTLSSQDLFKSYMNQDPGDMALYNSLITLPWSFKVIYGIITDNVKIFGLKRRPYLIFFGVLQGIMMCLAYSYDGDSALLITIYLFFASLSMAFSNVVVDAILVIQARKDPEVGS